jgi:hypothetical protein
MLTSWRIKEDFNARRTRICHQGGSAKKKKDNRAKRIASAFSETPKEKLGLDEQEEENDTENSGSDGNGVMQLVGPGAQMEPVLQVEVALAEAQIGQGEQLEERSRMKKPLKEEDFEPPLKDMGISDAYTTSGVSTRRGSTPGFIDYRKMTTTQGTNTDNTLKTHCCVKGRGCKGWVLEPEYMKAMVLMMSTQGLTPKQAIMSVYYMDTIIHGLHRELPLEIDKEYKTAMEILKILRAKDIHNIHGEQLEALVKSKKQAVNAQHLHDSAYPKVSE